MKQLLAELFEKYYIDVYTYLYSLCHDASLSEDLASDVFLEVVKSISSFRGQSDIKTWLFSIARHRWFTYLKRKKRQVQTESIHELYDTAELGTTDAVNEAAELCNLSKSYFAVIFKQQFGLSFARYERNFRLNGAAVAVRRGATLKEAADEWGFCDKSHLARLLKNR